MNEKKDARCRIRMVSNALFRCLVGGRDCQKEVLIERSATVPGRSNVEKRFAEVLAQLTILYCCARPRAHSRFGAFTRKAFEGGTKCDFLRVLYRLVSPNFGKFALFRLFAERGQYANPTQFRQ